MTTQTAGDFPHRLKPTSEGAGAPGVEELSYPRRVYVSPEPPKVFAEQTGPDALEIVLQQLGELRGLVVGLILWSLEQAPPRLGENRLPAVSSQFGNFFSSHLIDCHVYVPHDVKANEDVDGLRNLLRSP